MCGMVAAAILKPVLWAVAAILCTVTASSAGAEKEDEQDKDARYTCIDRGLKPASELRYTDADDGSGNEEDDTTDKMLHVAMIATNVNRYNPNSQSDRVPVILHMLDKMITSILAASQGTPLHFIMITDTDSHLQVEQTFVRSLGRHLSQSILLLRANSAEDDEVKKSAKIPARFCLEFVDLASFTGPHRAVIDQMKVYYARTAMKDSAVVQPDGGVLHYDYEKYTLDLFYLAPLYHLGFPPALKQLIVLDVDLEVRIDLRELQAEFDLMTPEQLVGVVNDQFSMYKLYFENSMRLHPDMNISETMGKGFNTGVVLYDREKIRESETWAAEISSPAAIDRLAQKHWMVGTVGDQDWMTLMGFEHPDLIRVLACEFNLQVHPLQGITCEKEAKLKHHHGVI